MDLQLKFIGNSMESIWNPYGMVYSMDNPYGIVYSMDNPYGFHSGYGLKKWLGTQPKNSSYGITRGV